MSEQPKRVGLMELLQTSSGCQFVIPVFQRNYTWTAEKEVKQYLNDLTRVLTGEYNNHFLGILIYLHKTIDFSTSELSIIDGQQRLTTTFLIIYAIRRLFKESGEDNRVNQLDGQYLTNPYHADKIKYKLKPLVSDDDVYRCIVEERFDDIDNPNSRVLKNYNYIRAFLNNLLVEGYTANEILLALDKLYVVCVPISEEDNAQKIFESINATGVKLTAADLIRNFLLMDLSSDDQEKYYKNYWKKIEDLVSADSNVLEMFFRMFLAIKTFTLVPKNGVYRSFVDWVTNEGVKTEKLMKELLDYAKIFNLINQAKLESVSKELRDALVDFRKNNSDLPISAVMEFYRLYKENKIDESTLANLIKSINAYLLRRSICDMDSQNISKLFPTLLKKVLETCSGDYINIVSVLNQEMVGNNADTSGSYMPTNQQMHELLNNANVYKRPALRIILDRLELTDNPAPVDLSALSIEHLMPQTPTEEWLAELDTDEETYIANLHRLGNLTLAAKPDNSKMSNLGWKFKNEILKGTSHLTLNLELLSIEKWKLENIDARTSVLIDKICQAYPYPNVVISSLGTAVIDENKARECAVKMMFDDSNIEGIKKNCIYQTSDNKKGYVLLASKMYPQGNKEKYWFGYRKNRFEKISECESQYLTLICRNKTTLVICLPISFIEGHLTQLNNSADDEGNIRHYHIVVFKNPDGRLTLLLSKPTIEEIDITEYLVGEE